MGVIFLARPTTSPGDRLQSTYRGTSIENMKLLIAAAFAAFALVACDEHETDHVKSGNDHIKSASADYREAASSAADRAYHAVTGSPGELREQAADLADKTADALRK